ncbi:unnamed protein product [Acanthoscelides obtectus]|uniref:DUF4817 domain-containing protein n=2 Tax=Acanthoscelides obtectus TaxID=200917 RepID=A0A9P0LJN8_ACAOB|nr:unnamed protein product [Acanthoscelides obtectus]CAH1993614.1 unnamed protein product [Acanthoscelides obtectus]CAK1624833.1 hypothetical protein AOBTE_LOCUS2789 [Acanthoscelides obtectus]CAK1634882.1 hypothetical protein AOBTE_LOCUS8941 [Acanthoscelides obtectus]
MATMQQKAFCVLEYARCLSVVTVQRAFRRRSSEHSTMVSTIQEDRFHY